MRVRLPRVRLSVRGLMVAVAVAGLILGAHEMWGRRGAYLARASDSAGMEVGSWETAQVCGRDVVVQSRRGLAYLALGRWRDAWPRLRSAALYASETVRLNRLADRHARLRLKYERAARIPWLPVAPDPPEPD